MSDTPNTDAAKFTAYSTRHERYIELVSADFARAQERRMAELAGQLEHAHDVIAHQGKQLWQAPAGPAICPTCQGNEREMPCAYPSEDQPGCLRGKAR